MNVAAVAMGSEGPGRIRKLSKEAEQGKLNPLRSRVI
jgi:hypothetical protein